MNVRVKLPQNAGNIPHKPDELPLENGNQPQNSSQKQSPEENVYHGNGPGTGQPQSLQSRYHRISQVVQEASEQEREKNGGNQNNRAKDKGDLLPQPNHGKDQQQPNGCLEEPRPEQVSSAPPAS